MVQSNNAMLTYNDPAQNPWLDLVNFNIAYSLAQETPFSKLCQEIEQNIAANAQYLEDLPNNQLFSAVLRLTLLLYKGAHTLIADKLFADEKQSKYLEIIIRNIWQISNYLNQYIVAYQELRGSAAAENLTFQSKKLKYAFVFNATYELKTAHSIIAMYSKLMQRKTALTEAQLTAIKQLTEGLEQLAVFITQAKELIERKSKLPPLQAV